MSIFSLLVASLTVSFEYFAAKLVHQQRGPVQILSTVPTNGPCLDLANPAGSEYVVASACTLLADAPCLWQEERVPFNIP